MRCLKSLEDAEDRMAVPEDCLPDREPEQNRYLLSMADTMRIIDGVSAITVWREKRRLTVAELARAIGLRDGDLATIEDGGAVDAAVFDKIVARSRGTSGDAGGSKGSVVGGSADGGTRRRGT